MRPTAEEIAVVEAAYRKALFKLVGLGVFIVACCAAAVVVRKMFGLPSAFLSVVFIVALLLFSPDIFRFMVLRNKLQSLREDDST
jgi:hypothetical protein